MKRLAAFAALICLLALCTVPAQADFTGISQPTSYYTGQTTLLTPSDPDFVVVSSLGPVGFSSALEELTVPFTWATWNSPPAVETSTPRVLFTGSVAVLTLSLGVPAETFGFELEPESFLQEEVAVIFYDGVTPVGTIDLFPSGAAGALLFAATTHTSQFTSVSVEDLSGDGFAIANLRYGGPLNTPEPSTVFLVSAGVLVLSRTRTKTP